MPAPYDSTVPTSSGAPLPLGTAGALILPPILAVEDSALDAEILRRTLRRGGVENPLRIIAHGLDAREQLAHAGTASSAIPLPCLILLDLHLPGATGWELLERIEANPALAQVPLLILTSADEDDARVEALGHARIRACRKPVPLELLKGLLLPSPISREG